MRLFVVEPLGRGGMIHYAYQLCTALAAQGADVTLVTAHDYELDNLPHNFAVAKRLRLWSLFDPSSSQAPAGPLAKMWRKVWWTARRGWRALHLIIEWLRLSHYLLAQQPDLVQFGKISFPFETIFLAWLRRRGLLLAQICHEFEQRERSKSPLTTLSNQLYASVYTHFSALFFHGQSNRQRFLSLFDLPAERLHTIPHGNESMFLTLVKGGPSAAELRQRYGFAPGEPVVLFFGLLAPSKGLPDLLQAFTLARSRCPAKLLVAGYPTKFIDMPELRNLVTDRGLAESVVFDARYIPMEEVAGLMDLAAVVVYPYRNSTQSGALQLAYAFGRPVIATRVGGLPEAVEEGRSGFLVSPESPPELAEAMVKLVNNPALAAEMGAYARHLSETRYSWQPIAAQILTVYQGLLNQRGQPHTLAAKRGKLSL
ncbi:MAG: glycosyltransferase family 4 protein [Anaerolineae bacterium]